MKFDDIGRNTAIAVLLVSMAAAAHGQYVWIDANGRKQYSDMPPPTSIPTSRILKQPGASTPASEVVAGQEQKDGVAEAETKKPELTMVETKPEMSLAEKELEFRKRRVEQAEKEKKAADTARLEMEKKKSCELARDYRRTLQSGERVARVNKDGERTILEDGERAKELREANRMLENCK